MAHVVQQQHAGDALGEVGDLDGQGGSEIGLGMTAIRPGGHAHSAGSARRSCIACRLLRAARIGGNSAYS